MMTERFRSNPLNLIRWQQRHLLFYLAAGTVAWLVIVVLDQKYLELPVLPLSVIGAAIGICASFRANQAYDRWWEGRKLWGRMINSSRHWSSQVISYVKDPELAAELVMRHVSYVHSLRVLLHLRKPFDDASFSRTVRDSDRGLEGSTNLTHALLHQQLTAVTGLSDQGLLDGHRLESMDRTLMDFLNIQGGCERIKGTPLPRGYGFIVETLINSFAILLPFALVHDLGAMAIPVNALVCVSFALISEAGRVLEDPFTDFYNGLPLFALSIKIERNLRERLAHTDLPPGVVENKMGVLM
jgi:putative membrane protein